ncbi:MAG: hypothetical protein KC729_06540 [Candidatus Eisenbacteria bacterium]|uniref:Short-chain dehydrogenase n=1 Tax=Eiseniibacteriota bacterium TaxID=2212470 RepID=A0A956LXR7_UNCEI|nr:hypothetical protein [Candidatus Eisenbacteria bacterium]
MSQSGTPPIFDTLLLLGGGGLVGTQVAKRAATDLQPRRIVIATLFREEARETITELARDFPQVAFEGYYGNIFLRGEPVSVDERVAMRSPMEQKQDPQVRRELFADLFSDFETAYAESFLVRLVRKAQPQAIVDCVNTATGISYQDVFLASDIVSRGLEELRGSADGRSDPGDTVVVPRARFESFATDLENLLVSISVPELILHTRLLHRVMTEIGTRTYVKVGTTGTGGMGLNIPYTHGEDRPSPTLMTKTAIAFAQTGLLFLMARTAGGPIVKEVKPAAMIGYRDIDYLVLRGPQYRRKDGRIVVEKAQPYVLYRSQEEPLGSELDTTPQVDRFEPLLDEEGHPRTLQLPAVNTGENGMFTRGEFEAITYTGQMEFITPEEIAHDVILELRGSNTGHDVISAVDSAVMDPTYKAGMIRHVAIEELHKLEAEKGVPSVALGQLGPPQLAKFLYEAHLFAVEYRSLDRILGAADEAGPSAEEISQRFFARLQQDPLREVVTSIGIPILWPDGRRIWRGPVVKIPAYNPKRNLLALDAAAIDRFAGKGWVDLRPQHMTWWIDQFRRMRGSTYARGSKWSSERLTRAAYLADEIRIGEVVAWLFNNTLDPAGHRIK